MNFIFYLLAAWLGVANMVLWGLYGDLVVEKFIASKVLRSFLFASVAAVILYLANANLSFFLIALCAIAIERLMTEVYKALIREEDQSKYSIPSDLNFKQNIWRKRFLAIIIYGAFFSFILFANFNLNYYLIIFLAGLITALGGMSKDAPYEGFELLKFFRSPFLALVAGLILLFRYVNPDPKFFTLAIFGFERILSEFYKKIYNGKLPGKFNKKIKQNIWWLANRKSLVFPSYITNIILLILLALFN